MTKLNWIVGGAFAIVCVVLINVLILQATGLLKPKQEPLFVNTDVVLKIFVEEATEGMDVGAIGNAMPELNEIMIAEANAIYAETGNVLLNAKTVLAGGNDISEAFAARVVRRWGASR